jgi:hypothetical protein
MEGIIDIQLVKEQLRLLGHDVADEVIIDFVKGLSKTAAACEAGAWNRGGIMPASPWVPSRMQLHLNPALLLVLHLTPLQTNTWVQLMTRQMQQQQHAMLLLSGTRQLWGVLPTARAAAKKQTAPGNLSR